MLLLSFGQEPDSCQRERAAHFEQLIQFERRENEAAFLVVKGTPRILLLPDGYWSRAISDRNGMLPIADEVMRGLGRRMTGFALAARA